jgi:hypothetical protein
MVGAAGASYHGHRRIFYSGNPAKDFGYFDHPVVATYRAKHKVKGLNLYAGIREPPASGKSASPAIGTRKNAFDIINARIFKNLEFLSDQEKNYTGEAPDDT